MGWGGGGGWGGYERWMTPLVSGCGGGPKKIIEFKMSVEAILIHFEAFFSCHTKLILQALAAFQMLTTAFDPPPHQQCINNCFDPSVGLIKRWHQT